MRIVLFGKNGQLGRELRPLLASLGNLTALGFEDLDLANLDGIKRKLEENKPALIVNAAAYTDVDRAESETDMAMKINGEVPGVMAEMAAKLGALLIHYSTDYVFDGTKGSSYTEEDLPHPINMYGRSKLEGEHAVQAADGARLILRTSWVYSLHGDNFVTKVLKWARTQETLHIVDDQVANPTSARMLAEITALLISRGDDYLRERVGLFHLAGGGFTSRYEWARTILEFDPNKQGQIVTELLPALTTEFPTLARRPLYTVLSCSHFENTFGLTLPDWEEALRQILN